MKGLCFFPTLSDIIRQQNLKFSGYFREVVSCVPNFEWKTETACNSTFKDYRAFKDCHHHVRPSWTRSSAVCLMACQRLGLRSLESWFGWSGNHGGKTQQHQGWIMMACCRNLVVSWSGARVLGEWRNGWFPEKGVLSIVCTVCDRHVYWE